MSTYQTYLDAHQPRFQDELLDFLRIPSISALPAHKGDVQKAGEWVVARLQAAGAENVQLLPTAGHPVVYGDWLHAPGQPTILIYGHFDVQPVDPLHLWTNPPFEPTIDGDKVFARGASDDKGNMLVPILAVEALLKGEGSLPVNVKFCFEGQEEIGSPQIPGFLAKHKKLFACDLAVSADGGQWSDSEGILLVALRGICGLQIDVKGAKTDLHSGGYGGTIRNPAHVLAELLASMHDADGRIAVDGFYDDVVDLTDDERSAIARVPFDEEEYLDNLGLEATFGEAGFTTRERVWARPTLEVNGMWSGFQGEGIKTVLPNEAHAKITCRLVSNQRPEKIVELVKAHVAKQTPPGVTATVTPEETGGKPYVMAADHWGNQVVADVLRELYGTEPYHVRSGGSIPITGVFLDELGAYTVSFGFGLRDEGAHAPDEFFRLSSFVKGQAAYCQLLKRFAKG
jgi:acetylornithine deacetylase/succinyl-diaminopimelate desuccinylase-like protein